MLSNVGQKPNNSNVSPKSYWLILKTMLSSKNLSFISPMLVKVKFVTFLFKKTYLLHVFCKTMHYYQK